MDLIRKVTAEFSNLRLKTIRIGITCLLLMPSVVTAQTIDVGNTTDLNNAIQTINGNPSNPYTLNLLNGFTLNQVLPVFNSLSTIALTGNSNTIDGNGLYQPLTINSGVVSLQSLNVTNATPIAVNGGKLIDKSNTIQGLVTNNGIIEFNQTATGTYAGNMSGSGSVLITGAGTENFTGTNSYTGGTTIDPMTTLRGSTDSLQGSILNNGFLQFVQNSSGTYSGNLSGNGMVMVTGTGPLTFSGTNSYVGGTFIDSGSYLIGNTSSLVGAMSNSGTVEFNQSAAGTFAGAIGGGGKVVISGTGPITFSGTNTYSGGTQINSGSSLSGGTAAIQGNIANQGSLIVNQATAGYLIGSISGAGSVRFTGGGPVTLMSANSYTGGTTVDSGTTVIGATTALQGAFTNNGLVHFDQTASGTYGGNMSGSGSVEVSGGSRITFSGTNSYTGGTTIDSATTLVGSVKSIQGQIINNGAVSFISDGGSVSPASHVTNFGSSTVTLPNYTEVYSGNMSGTGSLELTNMALHLTGTNSYSGGTKINSGAYLFGTTDSIQGNITNNGSLIFDQSIAGVLAGNISGTGAVVVNGNGIVALRGVNNYTGGTFVGSSSLLIGTTSSLAGSITSDGAILFNQNDAGTFAGSIGGNGQVLVSGAGAVTFSGTNSYTGGTAIDVGSTLIGNTQNIKGDIMDDGIVRFNQTTSGTYDKVISGAGQLQVTGPGTLTLTKANTFSGGTTISNDGTLIVGSTGSLASAVTVGNTGTLKGSGTVQSTTVNAGGTIAPGGNGSTLKIHGNLNQAAGSSYSAALSSSQNDSIHVTGQAQIANATKLNLLVDSSTYTVGTHYAVLKADGGITGTYSSVVVPSMSQNILFDTEYDPNQLNVVVTSNLSPLAVSANQRNLAAVLDQSSRTATGDFADALTQLTTLDQSQLGSALNQVSADIYPSINTVQRQVTTVQMQMLSNRLAYLTSGGMPSVQVAQQSNPLRLVSQQSGEITDGSRTGTAPGGKHYDWSGWAQGFGLGGNIGSDGNAGGTRYQLGGTLFGVERWLAPQMMVGVLGGYSTTSIKDRQSEASAQVNGYQVGVYELLRTDNRYVSNIDSYVNTDYDVTRPMQFGTFQQVATGRSSGNQWAHYTEGGLNLGFDDVHIQPFVSFQYMYLNQRGLTESDAGSLGQTIGSQTINSFRNGFGARISTETSWRDTLVVPFLSARYQHEWGNGTSLISSTFNGAQTVQYATSGNRTGRDFGTFTLGLTAYLTEQFQIYGSVDAQVASRYAAVIGSGGIQYSW